VSIAKTLGAIQIVDTHETLEPRITIGVAADQRQLNRTLLIGSINSPTIGRVSARPSDRWTVPDLWTPSTRPQGRWTPATSAGAHTVNRHHRQPVRR